MTLRRGDKKLINAWAFYDWANSVYALVISTAVFPIYYSEITESFADSNNQISFLFTEWNPTTLYSYILAFSYLIVAFLSPILSGIADYTGNKLKFLKVFCYLGSFSVISLFFFQGESTLWVGITFTILASVGFWGSIVFYNAYLPEVAFPEQQDKVSARGFIFGYIGSVFLLGFSLAMMMYPKWFNFSSPLDAMRLTFVLVGIWWIGFAQVTYRRLPNNVYNRKPSRDYIWKGLRELKIVAQEVWKIQQLKLFLISFFLFSVGVQTIILMASVFGTKELELPRINLIIVILLVQIVAIFGAFFFSRLSSLIGNISALKVTIVIWAIVCVIAYSLDKSQENVDLYFYGLVGLIGFVLGAIQSLSRSTYSKLLPETKDHATFFSFYDVSEKIAIVLGMFSFGLINSWTKSMQMSVLFLAIFFFASFIVLNFVQKTKYVK